MTSNLGEIEHDIPQDRNCEYKLELIPKGTKDVSALEEKVQSLYAKGVSDCDISNIIDEIYGFELSHETISHIIDCVQPRVIEWQNRRLEKAYPFVFMDTLMVSINGSTDGRAERKSGKYAVYSIMGVNSDGIRTASASGLVKMKALMLG